MPFLEGDWPVLLGRQEDGLVVLRVAACQRVRGGQAAGPTWLPLDGPTLTPTLLTVLHLHSPLHVWVQAGEKEAKLWLNPLKKLQFLLLKHGGWAGGWPGRG